MGVWLWAHGHPLLCASAPPPSADGPLGYFHLLAVMSNAGNISVQILVGSPSFSLGEEFLGPFVALCLIPKVVNIFHPPLFDCLSGVLSKVSPTPTP